MEAGGDARPRDVFLVAGEPSGDQLGFKLMRALRALDPHARLRGVGGPAMEREGLRPLFPMDDIAVMGFLPVVQRLPLLLRRIRETAEAVIADPPDALVIIDRLCVLVRTLFDFIHLETSFNGVNSAAHFINALDVFPRKTLHLIGEGFNEI